MVSKKQKFKTVILVLILAVLIVGGVFGISYYKGGVTFPWQVTGNQVEESTNEKESDEVEKEAVVENVKPDEPEATEETESDKATEESTASTDEADEEESEDTTVAKTGNELDYYGPLHVEDGKLVASDGSAAQLVGVSTHGLSWFPQFATAESIESLRTNLGINVIRLAVYTSDYNGYCVADDDIRNVIKENIDEAVQAATDNDMYVIIDWHILNDGDPNEYKSEAIQFFGELVRKYDNNENVIYEICNEPNGDTTWSDIKRYAKEVIPVIRNVDKDALILVGTPEWSSDLDSALSDPLDYDNIMYTYHFYAGSHKASARKNLVNALEEGLPVFISEYGFTSADGDGEINTREADEWVSIINEYGLSSCIWNLSNKDEASALINADCDKTTDFEYDDFTEHGQYFFKLLAENYFSTDGTADETEDVSEPVTSNKTNTSNKKAKN